jgi:hypothetical protein
MRVCAFPERSQYRNSSEAKALGLSGFSSPNQLCQVSQDAEAFHPGRLADNSRGSPASRD